jgi:NADPH:quinone reductase-like Zn-dependent oxidoreductase
MKAAVLKQTGHAKHLTEYISIEDIPLPEITEDEVLIKILSASLNHRDLWIMEGSYSKIKLPVVLGSDGAGIIHSKGINVKDIEPGGEVMINPGMNWGEDENFQSKDFKILGMPDNGTLAEYVKINKEYIFKKPTHLTFEEACAFPLAGITAFRSLFNKAKVLKNENVLITGIGGGVASFALVFALKAGANVFVTSGHDQKIEKAISLGANGGVNYKNKNWDKDILKLAGNNINVVIDGTGGDKIQKCVDLCSSGARIVSYGATSGSVKELNIHKLYWKQLKLMGSTMGTQKDFEDMMSFIDESKIKPVIDKVFNLSEVAKAFERMSHSEQFGKIIISIN